MAPGYCTRSLRGIGGSVPEKGRMSIVMTDPYPDLLSQHDFSLKRPATHLRKTSCKSSSFSVKTLLSRVAVRVPPPLNCKLNNEPVLV